MKTITIAMTILALANGADCGWGQTTNQSYTYTPQAQIPDGNPVGWLGQFQVSGLEWTVQELQVSLDISGGNVGDLYVYLQAPGGQTAVLLNRLGVSASNPYGSDDSGVNVLFDLNAAENIHYYNSDLYDVNASGQLVGTWAADGRNIDPESSGLAFDQATPSAGLEVFSGLNGTDVNGTWSVYVADCAVGGGTPVLVSVGLQVTEAPEPQSLALLISGGLLLLGMRRLRM